MSSRRDNRTAVVQFLYMWDINPSERISESLRLFFETQDHPRDYYGFAEEMIDGVIRNLKTIDETLQAYSQNWNFKRIAKIDLAILRLAMYELMFRSDVPPIVSINEAIELSKCFSERDSKRFINGILDRYKVKLKRPLREAEDENELDDPETINQ